MTKQSYTTVTLPCKTYIKKFVHYMHGLYVVADNSTALGCLINASLEKNLYVGRHFSNSYRNLGFEDTLTVYVNSWQRDRLGFDFSKDKVIALNRFLDGQFKEALYLHCHYFTLHYPGSKRDNGYKQALENFMDLVGLVVDLDITYDGIKKMEWRYRNHIDTHPITGRRNLQKSCAELSPIKMTPQKQEILPTDLPPGYTKAPDFSGN